MENDAIKYALDNIEEEVYAFDPDGVVLYANRPTRDRYNLTPGNNVSRVEHINPLFTPELFGRLVEKIERNGGRYQISTQHPLPGGGTLPLEVTLYKITGPDNKPMIWGYGRDMSGSVQQQRKISELNSIMEAFMVNSPLHLYVKRASDLRYLYWNRAMERATKIEAGKAIGMTDSDLFTRAEDIRRIEEVDRELAQKGGTIEVLQNIQYRSGQVHNMKSIKTLIRDADFEPMIVGVTMDITDMKTAEQELIKARMAAEKSSKLKGALVTNLSHDMRTSLNDIAGFTGLMSKEADASRRSEQYGIISKSIVKLMQEINDVVDISKMDAGKLQTDACPFSVKTMCGRVRDNLHAKMPHGVELLFDGNTADITVEGDERRLEQVLTNVIACAVKYVPRGRVRYAYRYADGKLEIAVEDNGIGMARDDLNLLFQPYTHQEGYLNEHEDRLKMVLSKMMVETMGGTLTVDSTKGVGSSFVFTAAFRRVDVPTPAPQPAAPATPATAAGDKRNVLVAEDVDSNYQLLMALIGRHYDLRRAGTGLEALNMFQEPDYHPDIILMDMKMPVMGGLEATRAIRKLSTAIPIVALTANAFNDDRVEALAAGCNDFLTKPVTADVLRKTIDLYTAK